ncbi:unnamed protein product, partial [Hapterophycus canaliculatus]
MGRVPDNIVISPGPGRPDVPEDFGMCAQALREAVDIPILGVCLGHEGLGIEHGASVTHAAEPMHGRLSPIFHDEEDPLFRGVPQGSRVVRYHSLVVDRATLPADGPLKATAWTGDGALMAMRHEQRPHWGVQFHPESVGTRHGLDIVRNFRDLTVALRGEAAPRMPRRVSADGAEIQRAAPAAGIVGELPKIVPPTPLPDNLHGAADAATPGVDTSTAAAGRLTPKRRSPFVLLVEEVEMAGGALNGVGEEGAPNGSKLAVPGVAGSAMPDTEHAFRALYGDDPTAWWLDSSSQRPGLAVDGQAKARFTFMGGADGPLSQTIERSRGSGGSDDGAEKSGERREVRANIMDYLKAEMAKMGHESNTGEAGAERQNMLPFDFLGGFVGFLGYELRHEANTVLARSAGGTEWDW